jgi:predicted dithiol-disulfide oxidoreductase (DUF899 family)
MAQAAVQLIEGDADPEEVLLDRVFFALSDPVRRAILGRLGEEALLVSELAAPFDISLQAVSRHIQVLVRAGLVRQERTGRISRCSLAVGPILQQVLAGAVRAVRRRAARSRRSPQAPRRQAPGRPPQVLTIVIGREAMIENHRVVSHAEWLEARKQLLAGEKELTRARDALSQLRRDLPWEHVEKPYAFEGPNGRETLAELFAGRSQLIVYHFMFDPAWETPCKSCSFWADNFNGIVVHLARRDVTMLAVSRAPLAKLDAFKRRMGWTFKWVSSGDSGFNHDYDVSFAPGQPATYNYAAKTSAMTELPGISVFARQGDAVFHAYSCYQRGLDMMNGAYHFLDLVPKGRDESGPHKQSWVRFHDSY